MKKRSASVYSFAHCHSLNGAAVVVAHGPAADLGHGGELVVPAAVDLLLVVEEGVDRAGHDLADRLVHRRRVDAEGPVRQARESARRACRRGRTRSAPSAAGRRGRVASSARRWRWPRRRRRGTGRRDCRSCGSPQRSPPRSGCAGWTRRGRRGSVPRSRRRPGPRPRPAGCVSSVQTSFVSSFDRCPCSRLAQASACRPQALLHPGKTRFRVDGGQNRQGLDT